jgi:hypothetical protein
VTLVKKDALVINDDAGCNACEERGATAYGQCFEKANTSPLTWIGTSCFRCAM